MAGIFVTAYNKIATTRRQLMDSEYVAYGRKTNKYLMMKTVTAELTTDEAQTVRNKQPTLQLLPSPLLVKVNPLLPQVERCQLPLLQLPQQRPLV
jgi:hypothetical protein